MVVIFVLGFFLDFIEIAVVVVPIVAPILLADPSGERHRCLARCDDRSEHPDLVPDTAIWLCAVLLARGGAGDREDGRTCTRA
jgi:hypothetical protein